MKKFTKIEVSFGNDFVPFLRRFNRDGRDMATVFYQESEKDMDEAGTPDAAFRICKRLQDITAPEGWVSGSFVWDRSTDGREFWEEVDLQWRQFLSKETVGGESELVGEVVLDDIQSLISESIQGKYYTVKDLSYNRPVKEEFESCTWDSYTGSKLTKTGGKYLILSDRLEDKRMSWISVAYPRPMIKVWIPELNSAWWVFFYPSSISAE